MTLEVRRIVTGHNEFGMGIIVSDEKLSAVSRGLGANISGCEIWSTNSMPVDNSMEAEASQRAGFVKKYNYVGSGQGTTVRIVEWTPGHAMFWHRTETLDYSMVLSGEIDVEFDSGQVVTMKQGDIIVMRGVTHCWKNKSTVPAVTALSSSTPFPSRPLARRGACSFQREAILAFCARFVRHFHTAEIGMGRIVERPILTKDNRVRDRGTLNRFDV